jgi:hypothetical protein
VLRSAPLDPMGERDQHTGGIAGNQVAWELIPQGSPAIQTTFSPRSYMSALGELRGEKWVTPNNRFVPPQFERHAVMCILVLER